MLSPHLPHLTTQPNPRQALRKKMHKGCHPLGSEPQGGRNANRLCKQPKWSFALEGHVCLLRLTGRFPRPGRTNRTLPRVPLEMPGRQVLVSKALSWHLPWHAGGPGRSGTRGKQRDTAIGTHTCLRSWAKPLTPPEGYPGGRGQSWDVGEASSILSLLPGMRSPRGNRRKGPLPL